MDEILKRVLTVFRSFLLSALMAKPQRDAVHFVYTRLLDSDGKPVKGSKSFNDTIRSEFGVADPRAYTQMLADAGLATIVTQTVSGWNIKGGGLIVPTEEGLKAMNITLERKGEKKADPKQAFSAKTVILRKGGRK